MSRKHAEHIAIIGAGLSGLSCANALANSGASVRVYDKGRGPGGRTSTRRAEVDGVELSFDHGAQYFTVRDPRIESQLRQWTRVGVAKQWEARVAVLARDGAVESYSERPRFVGTPTMSAICKHLAVDRDVRCGVTISRIERHDGRIALYDANANALGTYDRVVCTAPPEQTAALLADAVPELAARAREVVMKPCWALMVAFDSPLDVPFDGAFINDGPLSWIARMGSKPFRPDQPDAWVIHASPDWSTEHLEGSPEDILEALLGAFFRSVGRDARRPVYRSAHRWRFAIAETPLAYGCLSDQQAQVVACGDWTNGNRVEGALLAGLNAAARITAELA